MGLDRDQWQALVNTVMNPADLKKAGRNGSTNKILINILEYNSH
jgi:hypothetical protein